MPVPSLIDDKDDVVIVSIQLKSGKFNSTIQVPLYATEERKREFVESWLSLMGMALKFNLLSIDAQG